MVYKIGEKNNNTDEHNYFFHNKDSRSLILHITEQEQTTMQMMYHLSTTNRVNVINTFYN